VTSSFSGHNSSVTAARRSVSRTVDGAPPTRIAIDLCPSPCSNRYLSISRTRRISSLSAGIPFLPCHHRRKELHTGRPPLPDARQRGRHHFGIRGRVASEFAVYHHGCSPTVWASKNVNSPLPRIVPDQVSNNHFAGSAASIDAQARSTSENAGFFSRADEGELCFFSGDLPVHRGETGSPSSGKGFAPLDWPRGHQARHGITRAGDAPEMIGVFDHQFDWLVPKIVAHVGTSGGGFPGNEIRSLPSRSGYRTKVPGAYATKGRGVRR
jgi:hypothetical protein